MDKLKAMRTFVQIATDGSLTAAARSLDSSLPAVVRLLAALEDSLGVRLLNRTTRRISLTEEGQRYLQSCTAILASIEEADASVIACTSEPSGSLLITAPLLFGQIYVAPVVTQYVQRYDKVQCRLYLNDRNVDLLEENIDLAVRIGDLPDSTHIAQQIGSVRRVVVASPEYLERQGIPEHPRDLMAGNVIPLSSIWNPWTFTEKERPFSVPVNGNLEFNMVAPAIDACLAGLGFGMFLSYQVAPYVLDGRLQVVLKSFEPPAKPVSIVYPHAQHLPVRTRLLIDDLKRDLKGKLPVIS